MIGEIPKRYARVGLKNSEFTDKELEIIKETLRNRRSLLLTGKTGSGKTHLAACIYNLCNSDDIRKVWYDASGFIYEMRRLMFSKAPDAQGLLKELLEGAMNVELLILDDLGAEPETEVTKSVIERILMNRYDYERWTIITTNLDGKALNKRYSPRIISRIYEDYTVVVMNSRDRRKEKFGKVVEV